MLNFRLIYKVLGQLLYLEAMLLAACLGVGLAYGERDYATFGLPVGVAVMLGVLLSYCGRRAPNRMSRRDGFLIVSLTWVVFSLVGMLPFLVGGCTGRVAAAFFETMSGFTTTGATVFSNVDALPHSILMWRSLTHWFGGMGIVFFTIAILPNMGGGGVKFFAVETTGVKLGKLHPRLTTTARWIWSLYFVLTLACCVAYRLVGMNTFDAVNHGLSTIGTGGFSTHTESFGFFHSPRVEWTATIFMVLAGINCTLLYLLFIKRKWRTVWRDDELRCYLLMLLTAAACMFLVVHFADGVGWSESLRAACFNVASMQTTTGFTCADFMAWHPLVWLILTNISIIGACAGSTSGGLKCVRILVLWKLSKAEFRQMLHPHAFLPVRISGKSLGINVARSIMVFLMVYFLLILVSTFIMVGNGLTLLDAFGLAISSFSNVGPSVGHLIGPLGSWGQLSDGLLWLNAFLMLAGRLEIFSLLLPFTPAFWRDE